MCSTESSGSVELEEGSPPAPRGSPPATPAPAPDLDLQLDYWPVSVCVCVWRRARPLEWRLGEALRPTLYITLHFGEAS